MQQKLCVFLVCFLCVTLCCSGCSKKSEMPSKPDTTEPVAVAVTPAAVETVPEKASVELESLALPGLWQELLASSQWAGVGPDGSACVLDLDAGGFSAVLRKLDGIEETLSGTLIPSFSEGALKLRDLSESLNIEVSEDLENPYLMINGICLTPQKALDTESLKAAMDTVVKAAEYLSSGRCWFACDENAATLLMLDGGNLEWGTLTKDGQDIVSVYDNGLWSMNADGFRIFGLSGGDAHEYTWTFIEEGELKEFSLSDTSSTLTFQELAASDMETGGNTAEQYLQNMRAIDDISDYTTLLNGYRGGSIVDAFAMAGLNPSFANRAAFAKAFGIEDYRGTAQQNLLLLRSMGGGNP